MIQRVVSGGQSGVDRAALDAALALGLPCGGWCPAGRWAEDGLIPSRYPLRETPSERPEQRTAWNVRDSDGTLILAPAPLGGGTQLTLRLAGEMGRPVLVLDPQTAEPRMVQRWAESHGVRVLNVAGPRESEAPGIYQAALRFLNTLLRPETPRGPPE